jgi:phosphatidylglycerophosphate synthase
MAVIPERRPVTVPYRRLTNFLERHISLPAVNPALYQLAAILASLAYLYVDSVWLKAALVAFVLLTDWLDGATARQKRGNSREGYIMDVVIDRSSEMLIFAAEVGTPLGNTFFLLTLANIGLAYYSIRSGVHTSLPLRCMWLGVLLLSALGVV